MGRFQAFSFERVAGQPRIALEPAESRVCSANGESILIDMRFRSVQEGRVEFSRTRTEEGPELVP